MFLYHLNYSLLYLSDSSYFHRYLRYSTELGPEERPFYGGFLQGGGGAEIIYFMSPTVCDVINGMREQNAPINLQMDATFKVTPRAGGALQLFCVHLSVEHHVFPLLYAFMNRKTLEAYELIITQVRIMTGPVIESVMADYEAPMRRAILNVFPDTLLYGCWFHYARAVYLKSRQLGLSGRRRGAPGVNIMQGIRMAMALALLPNHQFEVGVQAVTLWMMEGANHDEHININLFIHYLRRQWSDKNISVYGEELRTNNSVEGFHSCFSKLVGRNHPNIWQFVLRLKQMEHSKSCDLIRLRRGEEIPIYKRQSTRRINVIIRAAEERLHHNQDVSYFLRRTSHLLRGLEDLFGHVNDANGHHDADGQDAAQIENNVYAVEGVVDGDNNLIEEDAAQIENDLYVVEGVVDGDNNLIEDAAQIENGVYVVHEILDVDDQNHDVQLHEDGEMCQICHLQRRNHVFVPCGHVGICAVCNEEMANRGRFECPICQQNAELTIRIYI